MSPRRDLNVESIFVGLRRAIRHEPVPHQQEQSANEPESMCHHAVSPPHP